jgi:hypothetical protein
MATFRTFFHGRMSGLEVTCLKSFLDHGHRVIVFAYDDTEIPALFETANAATVLPRERVFFYKNGPGRGSVAAFANLFRYALLARYGDWWTDTDVLCLKEQWPEGDCVMAWEGSEWIGNAVLKLPADVAEICRGRCEALGEDFAWGEAGPRLVTGVFREQGMSGKALPASSFYPVYYPDCLQAMDPARLPAFEWLCAGAFAFHLWHEALRRRAFDKRRPPPAGSFFGRAVRAHGTESYFR